MMSNTMSADNILPPNTEVYDPTRRYHMNPNQTEQTRGIRHVYRAFDSETAVEVAWQEYWGVSAATMNAVEKSIDTLKSFNHQNVMKYHEAWVDRKNRKVVFITEAMPWANAHNAVTNVKRFLSRNVKIKPAAIKGWLKQVLQGLQYLHSGTPAWLHRDLRCENIYMRSNVGLVKIGSLELGPFMQSSHPCEFDGTPGFMSPELATGRYDEQSDIYSFGMCALEMFTLKTPYGECTTSYQIFARQIQQELPDALNLVEDPTAVDFIKACICPSEQRYCAADLLQHPFFTEGSTPISSFAAPLSMNMAMGESDDEQAGSASNTPSHSGAPHTHLTRASCPSIFQDSILSDEPSNSLVRIRKSPLAVGTSMYSNTSTNNSANNSANSSMITPSVNAVSAYSESRLSELMGALLQEAGSAQTLPSSMVLHNRTIKCYISDDRCLRIYYQDFSSIDKLRAVIATDLNIDCNDFVLRYSDDDADRVLVTKRTTVLELLQFAKSLFVTIHQPQQQLQLQP